MMSQETRNHRILHVDDNPTIHESVRKVLIRESSPTEQDFAEDDAFLFGGNENVVEFAHYEIDSALQGQEALELVRQAVTQDKPYGVAIVDMRMPPGWDGLETVQHLWEVDPQLLVIFCTAFSDYSWPQMVEALGVTDRFVILKKPFDNAELQQLVAAMLERWRTTRLASLIINESARSNLQNQRLMAQVSELQREVYDLRKRLLDSGDRPDQKQKRVLVIDPETIERLDTERNLMERGIEVVSQEHSQEVLNNVYTGNPCDCVILEMESPNPNGYEVVRTLRQRGFMGSVVAYTHHERPHDREACLSAGYDAWVGKSEGILKLLDVLHGLACKSMATA